MDNNENIEVDINAYENARYQEILDSGKYAELKILVGTKQETLNGTTGIMPCIRLECHNADHETIGILYSSLVSFQERLEKEYPLECIMAKLLNSTTKVADWDLPIEDEKPKEED